MPDLVFPHKIKQTINKSIYIQPREYIAKNLWRTNKKQDSRTVGDKSECHHESIWLICISFGLHWTLTMKIWLTNLNDILLKTPTSDQHSCPNPMNSLSWIYTNVPKMHIQPPNSFCSIVLTWRACGNVCGMFLYYSIIQDTVDKINSSDYI